MKSTLVIPKLALITSVILFLSCGDTDNSDSQAGEFADEEFMPTEMVMPAERTIETEITGNVPQYTIFYDVLYNEDRPDEYIVTDESKFQINNVGKSYSAVWEVQDIMEEPMLYLKELEPGKKYEFKTELESGDNTTYWITAQDQEGIWIMTNSQNDHKGYLCAEDFIGNYSMAERGMPEFASPKEVIAELGEKWISMVQTEEGEWYILNECMYGSGGLTFDQDGAWLEFSGGGDAWSRGIESMTWISNTALELRTTNEMNGDLMIETVKYDPEKKILIFNADSPNENGYILASASDNVRTVEEECDEEGM